MEDNMRKVVIIGPESTGKSTLAGQLATHYQTQWVPEFAREYLLTNGMNYQYDDLLTIAKGQLALEDRYVEGLLSSPKNNSASPPQILILDTDMYVMKVWCEFVFSNCHLWILDQVVKRRYDLYLLCNTDLPWIKDELREYPDLESRERLYLMYRDIMINQCTPWIDVKGDHNERLQRAIQGINQYLF
jgi:NadR type nicotinamide-nucleotide adenylyltransferase